MSPLKLGTIVVLPEDERTGRLAFLSKTIPHMKFTTEQIGAPIKTARKNLGVAQTALAMTSGPCLRFIIKLEKGIPTWQFGKVLTVLNTLSISMTL
jgi:HTH-type transcriptional regulator / antitoxin HipB